MASSGRPDAVAVDVLDELLSALASRHNRAILAYLRESSSDVASLGELADHVVDSGDADPVVDSGDADPVVDSGDADPVVDSGDADPVVDSGDADPVVDPDGGGAGFRERERAAARLHHVALPKLAAVGVVDYDPRTNTVRYRGHPVVEGCWDALARGE